MPVSGVCSPRAASAGPSAWTIGRSVNVVSSAIPGSVLRAASPSASLEGDLVQHLLTCEEAADVRGRAIHDAVHAVSAPAANVRRHDHLRNISERIRPFGLVFEDIESGASQLAAGDRAAKSRLV